VEYGPVEIDGLAGPVVVGTNRLTGEYTVTVGGTLAARITHDQYALPAADGGIVDGTLFVPLLALKPTLKVNGVRYTIGTRPPLWLLIVAFVPFAVLALGGFLGGLVAFLAVIVNLTILRRPRPTYVTVPLMLGVALAAFVVWLVALDTHRRGARP
jgi:hypothetical protein